MGGHVTPPIYLAITMCLFISYNSKYRQDLLYFVYLS